MERARHAFQAVGFRVDSPLAVSVALELTSTVAPVRPLPRWPYDTVDETLASLTCSDLIALVDDLGLATVALSEREPPDVLQAHVRPLLLWMLRRRLVDAVRISAGLRPFWPWPHASRSNPGSAEERSDGAGTERRRPCGSS